jgi:hypothetical protein
VPERGAVRVPGRTDMAWFQLVEHPDERFGVAVGGERELALGGHQRVIGVRHGEEGAEEDAVRIEHDEAGLAGSGRWHEDDYRAASGRRHDEPNAPPPQICLKCTQ